MRRSSFVYGEIAAFSVHGLTCSFVAIFSYLLGISSHIYILSVVLSLATSLAACYVFWNQPRPPWYRGLIISAGVLISFIMILFTIGIGNLKGKGLLCDTIYVVSWIISITPLGVILVIIFISALIYSIREHARDFYAIIEGTIGACTASFYLARTVYHFHEPGANRDKILTNLLFDFVAIISGLYVVVRGFDNYDKYMESHVSKKLDNKQQLSCFDRFWKVLRGKKFNKSKKTDVKHIIISKSIID